MQTTHVGYVAESDYYINHQGVRFGFHRYITKRDRYGYERAMKLYVADKERGSDELNLLAKTPSGKQRRVAVNMEGEYFKEQIKGHLENEEGRQLYARRKIDVETVFGRLKGVFGMRRVHVKGQQAVYNDVGMMLMAMNLTKLVRYIKKGWCFLFPYTKKRCSISKISKYYSVSFMWLSKTLSYFRLQ